MFVLFVTDRLRYDLVAALALSAAMVTGVVPVEHAFRGFSNALIIIIASVLVLSRAVAVSGVVDVAMRRVTRLLRSTSMQVLVLTSAVTFLSAVMKNVGALGIFLPIGIQAAERNNRPPSRYLMPLSFGSLIGGTITLIGTSPNLLISTVRQETEGRPFHFFDFTPGGSAAVAAGDRVSVPGLAPAAGSPWRADSREALHGGGLHRGGPAA